MITKTKYLQLLWSHYFMWPICLSVCLLYYSNMHVCRCYVGYVW